MRWSRAIRSAEGRGIQFLEEVWCFHREDGCTHKDTIHHSKLHKWDHLLITCLADHLQHLILFKKVDVWKMLADNPNSKASHGVPDLITACIVISSLWQWVDFHMSGCMYTYLLDFSMFMQKVYETSPVRVQKVEETGRYTVSNIRYVDDSAILCCSFRCNALNTVVLNQVRKWDHPKMEQIWKIWRLCHLTEAG